MGGGKASKQPFRGNNKDKGTKAGKSLTGTQKLRDRECGCDIVGRGEWRRLKGTDFGSNTVSQSQITTEQISKVAS